jgi:DNA-binding NarL/FixJ family response regulator
MKKVRLLLADDHKLITESLKSILEPDYEVVGIVNDGQALLEEAFRLQPEVIVADISMPKLNGIDA